MKTFRQEPAGLLQEKKGRVRTEGRTKSEENGGMVSEVEKGPDHIFPSSWGLGYMSTEQFGLGDHVIPRARPTSFQ